MSGVEGRERGHIDNTWGTKGVHALFLYCTKSNCICLNICQIIRHECILKLSNPNKGNSTYSCFLLSLSRYLLLPHGHWTTNQGAWSLPTHSCIELFTQRSQDRIFERREKELLNICANTGGFWCWLIFYEWSFIHSTIDQTTSLSLTLTFLLLGLCHCEMGFLTCVRFSLGIGEEQLNEWWDWIVLLWHLFIIVLTQNTANIYIYFFFLKHQQYIIILIRKSLFTLIK